jgi:hypothetical protein
MDVVLVLDEMAGGDEGEATALSIVIRKKGGSGQEL